MSNRLITGNKEFRSYLQSLTERKATMLGLDIEGEFNLHVYGERLCLIQVYDGSESSAIDPVGIDVQLLQEFFEDRSTLKIMYDSLSDQALLFKTMQIRIRSILDLKPAVDLLEYEKRDLGSVLGSSLGITIEKKAKFQQYNWTTRPLAADAVEYALGDVEYLFRLKDHLLAELAEKSRLDTYLHKNLMVQNKAPDTDRKPRLFRSGQFRGLSPKAKTLFEQLYEIRDTYAREVDLPPDMLIPKQQLFQLASGNLEPSALRPNRRVPSAVRSRVIVDIEACLL